MIELIRSGSNVDRDYIYLIFTQAGFSSVQANDMISSMNYGGNVIIYGELLSNRDTYLIIYAVLKHNPSPVKRH